jgi:hypothetical protein
LGKSLVVYATKPVTARTGGSREREVAHAGT